MPGSVWRGRRDFWVERGEMGIAGCSVWCERVMEKVRAGFVEGRETGTPQCATSIALRCISVAGIRPIKTGAESFPYVQAQRE